MKTAIHFVGYRRVSDPGFTAGPVEGEHAEQDHKRAQTYFLGYFAEAPLKDVRGGRDGRAAVFYRG